MSDWLDALLPGMIPEFPLQCSFQRKGAKVTQSSQRIRTTFHLAPLAQL